MFYEVWTIREVWSIRPIECRVLRGLEHPSYRMSCVTKFFYIRGRECRVLRVAAIVSILPRGQMKEDTPAVNVLDLYRDSLYPEKRNWWHGTAIMLPTPVCLAHV